MEQWNKATHDALCVSRYTVKNSRKLLLTHLIYSGLALIVLMPLIGLISHLLVSLSGSSALTDQDILYFVLSPVGAISFLIIAILVVFVIIFEQACMMTIAASVLQQHSISVMAAIQHNLKLAPKLLSYSFHLVSKLLLISLPFIAASAFIGLNLLVEYDINFYLTERPPTFWWAVGLITSVLLLLLFIIIKKLLDWSMSLPLVLFANNSPANSFVNSTKSMASHRHKLLFLLFIWASSFVIIAALLTSLIHLFGSLFVYLTANSMRLLVLALGAIVSFSVISSFLLTTFSSGSFAFLIIKLFTRSTEHIPKLNWQTTVQSNYALIHEKFSLKKIVIFSLVGIAMAGFVGVWLLNNMKINNNITIIAHRGAAGSAPENTLAAMRQAIKDNTDWLEIDVQETVDGEVVVMHDSDYMKLAGVNLKVWEGTLKEIQILDIGSWFAPEFSAERPPTLADVLLEAKGKARVIIELKYYGHDQQLEQRVIDIVEQTDMVDNVKIMSLSYKGIQKVRKLRPTWSIGLLAAQSAGKLTQLDVDFLAVNQVIAKPSLILAAHQAGKQIYVWTINDTVNMSRMISLGVDGIITDEPHLAYQVRKDRGELSSSQQLLLHTALLLNQTIPETKYRDESP